MCSNGACKEFLVQNWPKEGTVVLQHIAEGTVLLIAIGCLFVEGARMSVALNLPFTDIADTKTG